MEFEEQVMEILRELERAVAHHKKGRYSIVQAIMLNVNLLVERTRKDIPERSQANGQGNETENREQAKKG